MSKISIGTLKSANTSFNGNYHDDTVVFISLNIVYSATCHVFIQEYSEISSILRIVIKMKSF